MIDALEVKEEVRRRASAGEEAGDMVSKLRVLGIYPQRHRGYFMLRTRIPGGFLTARQAETIGKVASEFARRGGEAFADLTTRQQVQMHWIKLESVPEIWERYESVGLTTLHTGGNAVRNLVACPLAGVAEDEVIDVLPLVREINSSFLKKEYANLPRKFKISISGCRENCTFAELNDIALLPAIKNGETGFNVLVGGGLGSTPRMAVELDAFVKPEQALEILHAIVEVYRAEGDYENHAINRFRVLLAKTGVEKIREEVEAHLHFELERAGKSLVNKCSYSHVGVYRQKQEHLKAVGTCVPVGRLLAEELIEFSELARDYGSGELRITPSQDLLLPNVPEDSLNALLCKPLLQKYTPFPEPVWKGVSACSGGEFCEFGIVETKKIVTRAANALKNWQDARVRIHASGCPASCARVQIADIALRGTIRRTTEGSLGAVDVGIGGSLENKRFIEWLIPALPEAEVANTIEKILQCYSSLRKGSESFADFYSRVGAEEIKKQLG